MTRILYLMETGEENLTEEEQGELSYALSYIKEGKDKNGTAMLLYEYLCLCGTERELTDIEKDYLAWGAVQLELVLLAYYGSEEERYEKVLTLLEKETWTEEETLFLCTEMEYYTSGGDTDKIAAIAEKLYTGYYEERNNLGITATYYKLGAEKDKIAALSQTCAGMGYSNAARLLGCVGETSTWGIETQIQEGETGSYYIEYCTAKDGTITMRLVIGIEGGEEGDGLWKEVTFGNDMGIALLSDEEVVEAYESIDNYNVIERSFSDEKNSDYIYKQMMESRYRSIKLAEAERIVNEYGLEEYLRVLYNPEAVTTAEERENAVKKTDELNEMGIDTLWLGTYYLHKQDEERLEETAEWAEEHEFISSLYSVPLKLGGSSCAALYQAGCYLSGTPINTDSTWYTDLKQANIIRGTVSEEIGELSVSIGDVEVDLGGAGQIGYQAVMGLADYALANTLTVGHGEILMAVEGYGESGYEAAARGLSPDAIQMLGINSAMSNVLTDKILLRACRGQHGFVRSVTEGSAEAAYEWLLTDTVDNWVSGDLSRQDSYYRTALAEGQTPEEAKATICEIRKQELLQAMAVGGTMSGMAWGGGRAYDYLINRINPGQVSTDTPESVTPLQEEGISEILEVGDGGVRLDTGEAATSLRDLMTPEEAARYDAYNEQVFFNEFAERASAAGLNNTEIVEAFEAMKEGDYAKMASYFDTSSSVGRAVFWSGNKEGAAAYANSIGGTIMEQTPGGQVFDSWRGLEGMYPEWGNGSSLDQKLIWEALSRQYANGVEGTATYIHPNGYEGKVWLEIERAILEEKDIIIEEVILDAK